MLYKKDDSYINMLSLSGFLFVVKSVADFHRKKNSSSGATGHHGSGNCYTKSNWLDVACCP